MISVVIPAHNEERTIRRCLASLLEDARPGELEVVVACNGCSDATAKVAREFGPAVRVVETERAGKPIALNLGDEAASGFPRFYVDADIEVSTAALRACAQALEAPGVEAAAPALRVDLRDCPWSVRAYYRIWLEIPYVRSGLIGSGVYGLSEAGRARFERFPEIIADDLFVRNLFRADERRSVPEASFTMRAPRSLEDLVKRKTRVFAGNLQLGSAPDPGAGARRSRVPESLGTVLAKPWLLPALPVYLYVSSRARMRAEARARRGDFATWDRDESTRL